MADDASKPIAGAIRRHLIVGVLTVIPIAVTYFIIKFVVGALAAVGLPIVTALQDALTGRADWLAEALDDPTVQIIAATVLVVVILLVLGWLTTRVIGRKLIALLDWLMDRVPIIRVIYGSVKKLLVTFQQDSGDVQRVVLIDFPSAEMKTVGLVTRTFEDSQTGRKLAAVYVPTTPNPTSGYLEIVPLENITETDWSVDEAMTFIVSGGAVTPENINYDQSAPKNDE